MRLFKNFSIFFILFIVVLGVYYLYKGYTPLIPLIIFAIPFIAVALHELGHLIFGLILGYKFVCLQLPLFLFYREGNKIKASFSPNTLFGGYCFMLPPNDKSRHVFYYYGGSIMNITCGILILIYISLFDYNIFTNLFLISNFVIAMFAMIPMMLLGTPNDGMVVFQSLQSKEARHGLYLTQYELNHRINGIRMRDLDDTMFAVNDTADLNNIIIAQVVTIEAKRLYDMGEYDKSFEQYNRLNGKKLSAYLQGLVYNGLIYYYIVHNPDYEQAKIIYNDKKAKKHLSLRSLCAYEYFVNGDKIKCMKYMKRIKEVIAQLSKRSDVDAIMEKEYSMHLVELIEKSVEQN